MSDELSLRIRLAYGYVFLSLLLGCMSYLFFRSGFFDLVTERPVWDYGSSWIIYSLPDGLWMFSLVLMILTIWEFEFSRPALLWWSGAVTCGVGFEFLQLTAIVPGTFDRIDLLMICSGAVLPLLIAYRFRLQSIGTSENTHALINKTSRR